jgi:hypothetical protein
MLESKSLNTIERSKKRRQRSDLFKKFNINADQYDAMLLEQNGVCAICQKEDPCNRLLAVDHCHSSGKIRALLCAACNKALGGFKDNPDILRKAALYIERYS